MLDPKMIRAEPDKVREAIAAKGEAGGVDRWLTLDASHREKQTAWEEARTVANATSKLVGQKKKAGEDASAEIAAVRERKAEEKALKVEIDTIVEELTDLLIRIPNLPADDVPRGADENDNVELERWGKPREFDFEPRAHWDLAKDLGILDLEAGGTIAGSGFPVLLGAGARLERALIQFMLDLHADEHGYTEVSAPHLSRAEPMVTCGQIPKLEADMYRCRDDELYLIPTGEVPLTNLHRGQNLSADDLPIRYVTHTPCYRREAGAAGKDTRGLIRVHQFHKVEMMVYSRPENSDEELLRLRGCAEEVYRRLGIHYRVMKLCTGDLSFAGRLAYDLDVWAPGVGKFLEGSSCTVFADFQARRANTRYRDEDGKLRFVHTLNGSGVALARTVIAVLETYQRADGSVDVPEALVPYMGGLTRIRRNGSPK